MAETVFSSTFHFARQVSRATNEPPAKLRRRVLLERAAWELQRGVTVTDAAFGAGYDSVDGFSRAFSRAFGCPPSKIDRKSTRLNSSHVAISYAVFCLKKKSTMCTTVMG